MFNAKYIIPGLCLFLVLMVEADGPAEFPDVHGFEIVHEGHGVGHAGIDAMQGDGLAFDFEGLV